jgi:predicted nucleic-acid-binding Zn-ribbon protein
MNYKQHIDNWVAQTWPSGWKCPACSSSKYVITEILAVPGVKVAGANTPLTIDTSKGVFGVPLICDRCGFVSLFTVDKVGIAGPQQP